MLFDPEGESILDEFVERFNARDFEALAELMTPDVSSELFEGTDLPSVVASMEDFVLRQPSVTATRGEVGDEALVALWFPEGGRYRLMGYLLASFVDVDGVSLLEGLDFAEELDDEDVLVEEPEGAEIGEWEQSEEEWGQAGGEDPTWVE